MIGGCIFTLKNGLLTTVRLGVGRIHAVKDLFLSCYRLNLIVSNLIVKPFYSFYFYSFLFLITRHCLFACAD